MDWELGLLITGVDDARLVVFPLAVVADGAMSFVVFLVASCIRGAGVANDNSLRRAVALGSRSLCAKAAGCRLGIARRRIFAEALSNFKCRSKI